jgi:T5SS/PEP-CTERM-associated repeat protein/autotransporter-associated beta strand protein
MKRHHPAFVLAVSSLFILGPATAQEAELPQWKWTGAIGNWTTAANWMPNTVPTNEVIGEATIDNGGTAVVSEAAGVTWLYVTEGALQVAGGDLSTSTVFVGINGGTGSGSLESGSWDTDQLSIGEGAESTGAVTIDGGVLSSTNLFVGSGGGSGQFTFNGGSLNTSLTLIGRAGSSGDASITGGIWTNAIELIVGRDGARGNLQMEGGSLSTARLMIGRQDVQPRPREDREPPSTKESDVTPTNISGTVPAVSALVTLSGTASAHAGEIIVGHGVNGSGTLEISAALTSNSASIGAHGGSGVVNIYAGTWENAGTLKVGEGGGSSGMVEISGGTVTSASVTIGVALPASKSNPAPTGGTGEVLVGPGGTLAATSNMTVGASTGSTAELHLQGGAVNTPVASLGLVANATGSAVISDGTWNVANLIIGKAGNGTMEIAAGESQQVNVVSPAAPTGTVVSTQTVLGQDAGSFGAATISAGLWTNEEAIIVGSNGTGTLNVTGGEVRTGTLVLAENAGSSGTLNYSGGVLNVAEIGTGAGSATVNIQVDVDAAFLPKLTGSLSFTKLGSGTTTITQDATYTGTTTVSSGTFIVNADLSSSDDTQVLEGATLGGSGTLGDVTVQLGGHLAPGNSPGIIEMGDLVLDGTLDIEIDGLLPGAEHDQVSVTGTVALSGVFTLALNYTPETGDMFFLILNDGSDEISGTFADLGDGEQFATPDGQQWQIFYTANGEMVPSLTGGNDVAIQAVPEPSTVALLIGAAGFLAVRRRKKN